jgi:hypothetical protein
MIGRRVHHAPRRHGRDLGARGAVAATAIDFAASRRGDRMKMHFCALHDSVAGPPRTSRDVGFCGAIGGQADTKCA